MVLLDRLRRNDKTYTELVFYENDFMRTDNFLDLVTAILMNTTVHTVRFHDCANPKWNTKQLKLLFATIARLPNLRLLSIAQTKISLQFLTIVIEKATASLVEVDIWGSELVGTDQDVADLAEALKTHSGLEAMFLKRVKFSKTISGLDPLLEVFKTTLDALTMERVEWAPGAVSEQALASLVSSNCCAGSDFSPSSSSSSSSSSGGLTHLRLEKLNLEERHFQAIADGVRQSTTLRDLHLSDLTMSDQAVASLAAALQTNESLKRLGLYKCHISDQGVSELAKMLPVNTTLSCLDLSENDIGDQGAMELSNALLMSPSIKRVELYGNPNIQERGIQALLQLAEHNYELEALELFVFSRTRSTTEQVDIQKTVSAFMDLNAAGRRTRRNSGKRAKVWYE